MLTQDEQQLRDEIFDLISPEELVDLIDGIPEAIAGGAAGLAFLGGVVPPSVEFVMRFQANPSQFNLDTYRNIINININAGQINDITQGIAV